MTRWYRRYAGTVSDPKLAEIALAVGCSKSVVIATWDAILECACEAERNGAYDLPARRIAAMLGEPVATIESVASEMVSLGMVADETVCNWPKRQFTSDSSTERSRKHRAKRRGNGDATLHGRCETLPETESDKDSEVEESPPSPLGGSDDVKRTPVSDWKQAFARPEDSTGVEFSHGRVRLVNGARAEWLEKFGGDAAALDLALIEVGPQVQVNNRVPVRAQVDRHLATIVRRRLEQDDRYARAVASRQPKAEAPRKRSVLDIIREKPASEVVQ